jgi:hypothetical protein
MVAIKLKDRMLHLQPNETVAFHTRVETARRTNDQEVRQYRIPTYNPSVFVRVPSEFAYEVSFGHRTEPRAESHSEPGFQRHLLEGTLLPHQAIVVRWWKKAPAPPSDSSNGHDNEEAVNPLQGVAIVGGDGTGARAH